MDPFGNWNDTSYDYLNKEKKTFQIILGKSQTREPTTTKGSTIVSIIALYTDMLTTHIIRSIQ